MARASSKRTKVINSPSPEFVRRTRDPDLPRPVRFERVPKEPGSYELVGGKLVEVKGE